jgi:hypothetical protein
MVRGLSYKIFQAIQALEALSDDELEGMARELKQVDERNTWYVTYQYRDTMLRMIRDEQAERRTRKARVLDDFDMFYRP